MLRVLPIVLSLACLACLACKTTYRETPRIATGFLGDISQLKPGTADQAALLWIEPGLDLSHYTAIIIDPVALRVAADSEGASMPPADQQLLVNLLYTKVVRGLQTRLRVVDTAGPHTLHLRLALTDMHESNSVLDVVSTILPIGWISSGISMATSGTPVFVGGAGVEMELLDAASGKRLAAAIDERVAGKGLTNMGTWGKVEAVFDDWVRRLDARLTSFGVP